MVRLRLVAEAISSGLSIALVPMRVNEAFVLEYCRALTDGNFGVDFATDINKSKKHE